MCWLKDTTTPQELIINDVTYSVVTVDGASARYALASIAYTNAAAIEAETFDAMNFGIKKVTAGGTTLFSQQQFLEVLTGPPNIITDDLPPAGDPYQFAVSGSATSSLACDVLVGWVYGGTAMSLPNVSGSGSGGADDFATGTLGLSLGNQGTDLTVPTTWRVNRIDIGYRDEGSS